MYILIDQFTDGVECDYVFTDGVDVFTDIVNVDDLVTECVECII